MAENSNIFKAGIIKSGLFYAKNAVFVKIFEILKKNRNFSDSLASIYIQGMEFQVVIPGQLFEIESAFLIHELISYVITLLQKADTTGSAFFID